MKLKEISDCLFHIGFNKTKNQNETFVRFHGYYENPKFEGKIFTKKQFDRWFKHNTEEGSDLGVNFCDIPSGFNFPAYVLNPFFEGKFDPLSEREKEFLNEAEKINRKKFYIISSLRRDGTTLNHEIAHGLFYLRNEYEKEIMDFLRTIIPSDYNKMKKFIESEKIYSSGKVLDEIHATLVSSYYKFMKNDVKEKKLIEYTKNINHIFRKYSKGIKGIEPFRL